MRIKGIVGTGGTGRQRAHHDHAELHVSIAALAGMIAEAVGWNGSFVYNDSRPDGAMQLLLDGTRFQEVTGWTPQVELVDGIRATVEWYAKQKEREAAHAC